MLIVTTVAGWVCMTPTEFEEYPRTLAAVVLFASNFYFWQVDDYFAPAAQVTPLLHTWSLAVEEQSTSFSRHAPSGLALRPVATTLDSARLVDL